uniref:Secreted protein n=1 Tax=Macrostomum lignano TaxID=282301 RepID=A0A1I8FNG4_9PLAT
MVSLQAALTISAYSVFLSPYSGRHSINSVEHESRLSAVGLSRSNSSPHSCADEPRETHGLRGPGGQEHASDSLRYGLQR